MTQFEEGQIVRVHPHGSPEQAAEGTITILSSNQRAIAIAFDHLPPFAFTRDAPLIGIHPNHGIMFIAYRYEIGPWIEMAGGGHYEIEEITNAVPG